MKNFNYIEWCDKYHNKEILDVKRFFTTKEIKILEKLGIEIKNKIYSQYDIEILRMDFISYYSDNDMDNEELAISKSLSGTGAGREEYNQLLDKINSIDMDLHRDLCKSC